MAIALRGAELPLLDGFDGFMIQTWIKRLLGDSPDETAFVRWKLRSLLEMIGYEKVRITPFDWLHPMTPRLLIGPVALMGRLLEKVPLLREFSGSLLIEARRSQAGAVSRAA